MKSFVSDKKTKLSRVACSPTVGVPYSALQKALRKRDVKVNGKRVNSDVTLNVGDNVTVYYEEKAVSPCEILYSDDNVIVVNKKSGFLSEDVFAYLKNGNENARFIHRLDRNTSGVMIFALNETAEKELVGGFKDRVFDKKYIAEVFGKMEKESDELKAYLKKDAENSLVTVTDEKVKGSAEIRTDYKVLDYDNGKSLLEVTLHSGKTHQIRAHLAHIGHPVVGDGKYGENEQNKKEGVFKQLLTAYSLTLFFDKKSPLYYLNGKTFKLKERPCLRTHSR